MLDESSALFSFQSWPVSLPSPLQILSAVVICGGTKRQKYGKTKHLRLQCVHVYAGNEDGWRNLFFFFSCQLNLHFGFHTKINFPFQEVTDQELWKESIWSRHNGGSEFTRRPWLRGQTRHHHSHTNNSGEAHLDERQSSCLRTIRNHESRQISIFGLGNRLHCGHCHRKHSGNDNYLVEIFAADTRIHVHRFRGHLALSHRRGGDPHVYHRPPSWSTSEHISMQSGGIHLMFSISSQPVFCRRSGHSSLPWKGGVDVKRNYLQTVCLWHSSGLGFVITVCQQRNSSLRHGYWSGHRRRQFTLREYVWSAPFTAESCQLLPALWLHPSLHRTISAHGHAVSVRNGQGVDNNTWRWCVWSETQRQSHQNHHCLPDCFLRVFPWDLRVEHVRLLGPRTFWKFSLVERNIETGLLRVRLE